MVLLKIIRRVKKKKKYIFKIVLIIFLILNVLSYLGAYTLTNFVSSGSFGLGLPRPNSDKNPSDIGLEYITQRIDINENEWLENWLIPAENSTSKGTIMLFPGNGGSKAKQLLASAKVFHNLGYDTLLVDFRGVGDSSGNTTTLGVQEAEDIALTINDSQNLNLQSPLILYGVSMGSAAILRAIAKENINPDGIILELPFARLLDAVKSRLKVMKIPSFPIAQLLVFWGGIQHGFNGFTHNPVNYATQVKCPTLILHGKLDKWTTVEEIEEIFHNLQVSKELVIFPNTGHNLLVTVDKEYWTQSIHNFLKGIL